MAPKTAIRVHVFGLMEISTPKTSIRVHVFGLMEISTPRTALRAQADCDCAKPQNEHNTATRTFMFSQKHLLDIRVREELQMYGYIDQPVNKSAPSWAVREKMFDLFVRSLSHT